MCLCHPQANERHGIAIRNIVWQIFFDTHSDKNIKHIRTTGCHTPCGGYSEFERLKLLINLI